MLINNVHCVPLILEKCYFQKFSYDYSGRVALANAIVNQLIGSLVDVRTGVDRL
jgi:hypothetical protein